jgi:type III secretion protein O
MAYGLEKLLTVRILREDRARNQLARSKAELARAEMHRHQKEKELVDYRQWRRKEETRLFGVLRSKNASRHELLLFNDSTNTLRQNQAAKVQQLQEAGRAVQAAEQNLVKAGQRYVAANRKKIKIEEHKSIWTEARHMLEEQYEEKEIESHTNRPGSDLTDAGTRLVIP